MKYAPIIIPTLNRIEHLKRCITSLQKNPWAKYTPLIVSVDYPPNERYVEGYKKVCKYLKEEILSIGKNSPYIGMELLGFPRYTILNDKLIWRAK